MISFTRETASKHFEVMSVSSLTSICGFTLVIDPRSSRYSEFQTFPLTEQVETARNVTRSLAEKHFCGNRALSETGASRSAQWRRRQEMAADHDRSPRTVSIVFSLSGLCSPETKYTFDRNLKMKIWHFQSHTKSKWHYFHRLKLIP